MKQMQNYKIRLADEKKLSELAEKDPNLVSPEAHPQFTPEFLKMIGIDYEPEVVGKGYIKLHPSDFIVEEINKDNKIINILPIEEAQTEEFNTEKPKTEADLVKQRMATFEAIERLSEALNFGIENINYAGLKDSKAITAQEISFNGLSPEKLQNLQIPNMFLKNIHQRKGIVEKGSLYGNRFTIHIRSDEIDASKVLEKAKNLEQQGFLNFFSLQRFGSRMLTHKIGKLVMTGQYGEVIKLFLVGESPHELKPLQEVRKEAAKKYGDWTEMIKLYNTFPYFFNYELNLLQALNDNNGNIIKGLFGIAEQVRFSTFSYKSYWFNKLLSYYKINNLAIPENLPLLNETEEVQKLYKAVMTEDKIKELRFFHPGLTFLIGKREQAVPTRMQPKVWSVIESPYGYIIHFDLQKGAYATTFLAEIFHLYQGRPIPQWVKDDEYDPRAPLGYSPISDTINHFIAEDTVEIGLEE